MGRGGLLVGSVLCVRKVAGSNPVLAATLSKFLAHNALQYHCICDTEALKYTSELGIHEEEDDIKDTDL